MHCHVSLQGTVGTVDMVELLASRVHLTHA